MIEEELIASKDAQSIVNASDESALPPPIFVRSEINLLALPIFQSSWRRLHAYDAEENTYEYEVTRNGTRSLVRFELIHTQKYGRLTPFDANVRRAFDDILDDQVTRFGYPLENPVPFSIRRLARIMQIKNPGPAVHYEIKEAIERIVATTIKSSGSWLVRGKDGEEATPIDDIFHIYDRAIFIGGPMPAEAGGGVADTNFLWLGSPYLQNINTRYVRPIDHVHLWGLKGILSRRLYELLMGRFYSMRKDHYQTSYSKLCRVLPATEKPYYSQARETLDPVHKELLASGCLSRVVYQRLRGKQLLIGVRYYPGERAKDEIARARGAKRPLVRRVDSPQITIPLPFPGDDDSEVDKRSDLAQELVTRGVSRKEAARLAREHPERIPEKIEYFDFLESTDSPLIEKNRGGWLRNAVDTDYALPESLAEAKETRLREQATEDRLWRYRDHVKRAVKRDLCDWDAVPTEDRISGRLELATSKWSADFRELAREHGNEKATEITKQALIDGLPQTEEDRRAYLEGQHDSDPPADFE